MIDLDKYKGHTPGPWRAVVLPSKHGIYRDDGTQIGQMSRFADSQLAADAPALLDEVKRLRWLLEQYGHDPDLRFAVEGW